jgi:hypothetical protein
MPVTKRTRYEVLRRDNHTCRYCGASAPDATLTVDHVTPVALGGADDPSNLVAACRDCNAGKASTSPDAGVVEDVKQVDIKWAGAIRRVAASRARQRKKMDGYVDVFDTEWSRWTYTNHRGEKLPMPRPSGWRTSVARFYEVGLPSAEVVHLVQVACGNSRIAADETFRYFAGCCWRAVTEMQEAAKALLESEASDGS